MLSVCVSVVSSELKWTTSQKKSEQPNRITFLLLTIKSHLSTHRRCATNTFLRQKHHHLAPAFDFNFVSCRNIAPFCKRRLDCHTLNSEEMETQCVCQRVFAARLLDTDRCLIFPRLCFYFTRCRYSI